MPFEVLSPLEVVPEMPTLAELPPNTNGVRLGRYEADYEPNVDGAGGSLALTERTEATELAPATFSVAYTLPDGTLTEATFDLPDGYSVRSTSGTAYGEELDRFVFSARQTGETDTGEPATTLSTVTVGVSPTGELSLLSFQRFPGSREHEVDDVVESVKFYPLGDGRLGYTKWGTRDDWGEAVGIAEQDGDGLTAVRLGVDTFLDAHVIALDDGGFLYLEGFGDNLNIQQFDGDKVLVEEQFFNNEMLTTPAGPPSLAAQRIIQLDENGDLEIFVEEDGVAYRMVLDILPLTEEEPVAGEGDDDVILTSGDDVFDALGGNDTVKGLGGQDWIEGGAGNDSIDGGRGDDAVTESGFVPGGTTDDIFRIGGLYGGAGEDSINGREGSDFIDGGEGNDDLRGGVGSDSTAGVANMGDQAGIYGGAGDDFIRGNRGNDELFGGEGNDDMNGGFGDDVMWGDAGDDKMGGFNGADQMFGEEGNDVMHGGRGDDFMTGGQGDDTLRGAEGADRLEGGEGDDLLIGGDGADTFGYVIGGKSIAGGDLTENVDNGTDTIKDFTIGEDKIELSGYYTDADVETTEGLPPILTFDDIFLSQEDSTAVIQAGDTVIRLEKVDIDELSEDDFLLS